jgi:hypothetical protein
MGCQARHEIFVAEDHREALMRWILDRSNQEAESNGAHLLDCLSVIELDS